MRQTGHFGFGALVAGLAMMSLLNAGHDSIPVAVTGRPVRRPTMSPHPQSHEGTGLGAQLAAQRQARQAAHRAALYADTPRLARR